MWTQGWGFSLAEGEHSGNVRRIESYLAITILCDPQLPRDTRNMVIEGDSSFLELTGKARYTVPAE